jgi:hypothetical protein
MLPLPWFDKGIFATVPEKKEEESLLVLVI